MDEYEIIEVNDLSNLSEDEKNQYKEKDSKPKGKLKRFISDASLFITIPILIISVVSMVFSIKSYLYVTQNMQGGVFYIENGNDANNSNILVDSFVPFEDNDSEATTAGTVVIVTKPDTGAPVTIRDNNSSNREVTTTNTETTAQAETTVKTENTTAKTEYSGIVNINTASKSELMSLNGIGEVKAQAIIDYREANGQFSVIEELMQVSGIGEKTFEKIRSRITVD